MGAYKSRPSSTCSEEWLKRVKESHLKLRARIEQDTNIIKGKELSPLQQACCEDDIDTILEQISDTNIREKTDNGYTLLHLCCMDGGCKSAVRFFARMGASINGLSSGGFTALHVASYVGDIELVSDLLIGGANAMLVGYASITPLHLASLGGHAQIAELLLRYDADLHTQDALMFTPLHYASFFGHDQVVKCLINHNADINMSGGVGVKPLHLACAKGFLTVTELLITGRKNNKADVNIQDNEKNTPLHYCARNGHQTILSFLFDPAYGVKCQEVNIYGDTALHIACYHGRLDITEELVARLDVGTLVTENIFSESPLHCACTSGKNLDLVVFLLKQPGVDINFQGWDGHTALHSACYHGNMEVVQLLIEHGASLDLTCNAKKQTCLTWAKEKCHEDVVAFLKKTKQDSLRVSKSDGNKELFS